ncbi:uncharacterized protein SPPG_09266 [Spizellomyces punctatus DAOM BR117]|uniref:histidine kinase n=1 Tax=Spizellomyces punctatus (strain DAOM BR117) TaxID=645134 RepID=A0A0L0HED6_SPIPD|nr:uncharacterized protein SPPG_09266 [Spizellomyces punctatus DAOM BR117]KNC99830.1 hypothetical protein SPPG_09266 [Spizellomyces punctatus DAOM BR117]|eukprot:XP_016607870.1 hypothetical protein SPPG_09266 [Spizellomyces punctatus DAOM BR117]
MVLPVMPNDTETHQMGTRLEMRWSWELVLISYVVSVLGSYTTTQLMCQVHKSKSRTKSLGWILMASITFGGCAIWSMHFVGMMALDIGIPITFDVGLTIASVVVAVVATFGTFAFEVLWVGGYVQVKDLDKEERGSTMTLVDEETILDMPMIEGSRRWTLSGAFMEDGGYAPSDAMGRPNLDHLLPTPLGTPQAFSNRICGTWALGRFVWTFWETLSARIVFKGLLLGFTVVGMHYTGMMAMRMDAVIVWDGWVVVLSVLDAWFVCVVAFCFMPIEVDLVKQFMFSLIAGAGTPLHAISGYTELIAHTPLTEEQKIYLDCIKTGCYTIQLITNNVLDFAKLERGNAETRARPVELDMRRLAADVVRSCAPVKDEGKCVDVILSVEQSVPLMVFVDEIYVTRIIMNLVSNAVKFTSTGYVLVRILWDRQDGDALVMRVEDTGEGIPESFLGTVFEPFRQADTSLTRKHAGTGLGLSICKQLVQRMSGTVHVESTHGLGSAFTIRLPMADETHAELVHTPVRRVSVPTVKPVMWFWCRSERTERLLARIWEGWGYETASVDRRVQTRGAIVWTDIELCRRDPSTLEGLLASMPKLVLVCYDELGSEDAWVTRCDGILLVKRPVIVHVVAAMVEETLVIPNGTAIPDENAPVENGAVFPAGRRRSVSEPIFSSGPDTTPQSGVSGSAQSKDEKGEPGMHKGRILLVEDNVVKSKNSVSRILTKNVPTKSTLRPMGQEALDKTLAQSYDCIPHALPNAHHVWPGIHTTDTSTRRTRGPTLSASEQENTDYCVDCQCISRE